MDKIAELPDALRAVFSRSNKPDVSPLRYPGGKRRLAPLIASLIIQAGLDVRLFVEPFAGGAAVSIALLESGCVQSIALADKDPLLAMFWKTVFSNSASRLAEMVRATHVTLDEWRRQKALQPKSELEAAFKCLFLNRTSFSGALMPWTGPMGGYTQSSENKIGSRFNRERLANRILLLNRLSDKVAFVRNESYQDTMHHVRNSGLSAGAETVLWYLDPPYFSKAKRLYSHCFDAGQHDQLARDIESIPGNWILSYDDHPDAHTNYSSDPGFALVDLDYCARTDSGRKSVREVMVSDMIARLREQGRFPDAETVLSLPRADRRRPSGVAQNLKDSGRLEDCMAAA